MNGEGPRRLHPGSIVLGMIGRAPSMLPGMVALFALLTRLGTVAAASVLSVAIVGIGLTTWLRWHRFTYRLDDGEVTIADGVLNRSRRSIPFERVQDVSIEQKLVQRLFGLATVRIETGGGEKDEARLDSVSLAEAARLRGVLRGRAGNGDAAETSLPGRSAVSDDRDVLFAMGPRRIAAMAAFSFSLVWVGLVLAGANVVGDVFDVRPADWVDGTAERVAEGVALSTGIVVAATLLASVVGIVSGMVQTLLREHGFRLERADGRLRRVRGLATRSEVVLAVSRIQLALIERRVISRRFGWSSLRLQTLGGSDDVGGRQVVAPFARDREVSHVLEAVGLDRFNWQGLDTVAAAHAVRMGAARILPVVPATVALGLFLPWMWLVGGVVILAIAVVAVLGRHGHRFGIRNGTLFVMQGVLVRREWIVPLDRIQAVSRAQGPLQRMLGLATVRVGTAGATGTARPDIVDLTSDDAEALVRELLGRSGGR